MKLLVISSAPVFQLNNNIYGYSPFVKEMNVWFKEFENILILAPTYYPDRIFTDRFQSSNVKLISVPFLDFRTFPKGLESLFELPAIFFTLFKSFYNSNQVHIRCPGNISLLSLIASAFSPKKNKIIKYAGNWDPKSKQPVSYKFQKWLLNHKSLIKNKKVLIYGKWKNQPDHVISFFTASFSEKDKLQVKKNFTNKLHFIFCGSLVPGKRPMLAVRIVHELIRMGYFVNLDMYGEGKERSKLEKYIEDNKLQRYINLQGNQDLEILKKAYRKSHFCILPSKSEGWPKAIAEGMFYGCIPIATRISCVPWMLANGKRGILIEPSMDKAVSKITSHLNNKEELNLLSEEAMKWSRSYTLEKFEEEIHQLV